MLHVHLICVGKLKEKYLLDAEKEYTKRLSGYCKLDVIELPEVRVSDSASPAEIDAAMKSEADAITAKLPKGAGLVALCVEGQQTDSEGIASMLEGAAMSGGRLCLVIGGSNGLHDEIKQRADKRLSLSRLTLPHHLARIVLLEQIYRGFKIAEGGKYHK